MAAVVLHLIGLKDPSKSVGSWLSATDKARADRFVFPADAARWSRHRAGLRKILGDSLGLDPADVLLIEGPGGKPKLTPPHDHLEFNLSHSGDLAVVVVSADGPVGIDIEPWSRAPSLIECREFFCHPDELSQLPTSEKDRANRLLEIWTSKEALLKALGIGLSFPPAQLLIDGDRGKSAPLLEGLSDFRLLTPDHPALRHHRVVIAVPSTIGEVIWHDESLR